MIRYGIQVIILLISLVRCVDSDSNNLGKDYYYMIKDDAYDIGFAYWDFIYKSDKKRSSIYSVQEVIPSNIVGYNYDDNYIIAQQKYDKNILKSKLSSELISWGGKYHLYKREGIINVYDVEISIKKIHNAIEQDSDNGLTKNIDKLADSIIINSPYYQELLNPKRINYYIIDKKIDSVYGPFNKKEFIDFKKKENINLNFNKTNSAKKLNQLKNIFK